MYVIVIIWETKYDDVAIEPKLVMYVEIVYVKKNIVQGCQKILDLKLYVADLANCSKIFLFSFSLQADYFRNYIVTARWKSMSGLELSGFIDVKVPLRERKFGSWKVRFCIRLYNLI